MKQPNVMQSQEHSFPLSVLSGVTLFPFKASWSTKFAFVIEGSQLKVSCQWETETEEPEIDEPEMASDGILLLRAGTAGECAPNVNIDRVLGSVTYKGIEYNVCTYMQEKEFTFVAILKPSWGKGGFSYHAPMWLPPVEEYIHSYTSVLIEDEQDVSSLRFAVYLTYSSNAQTVATLLSVERRDDESEVLYGADFRDTEEVSKVRPFSISELKQITQNLFHGIDEEM